MFGDWLILIVDGVDYIGLVRREELVYRVEVQIDRQRVKLLWVNLIEEEFPGGYVRVQLLVFWQGYALEFVLQI